MKSDEKGTGSDFCVAVGSLHPAARLGTEILSWERFNALNN